MHKLKKSKGFTLIELMIVVAIIGILAAVAIPKFADLVNKSKEAAVKGTLGAVRSAVSIYYGDMEGSYPTNLFAGLTTANKYMPSMGNVQSLGAYTIPKTTTGNTGHSGTFYSNLSDPAGVRQDAAYNDLTALDYTSVTGDVYINCTHNDTKSIIWTSY
jgi:prepilin-type N-terminal cleavage/methylation domain-containing protein